MNKNDIVEFKVRKLHCTNYVADGVLSLSPPARFNYFFLASRRLAGAPGKIDDGKTVDAVSFCFVGIFFLNYAICSVKAKLCQYRLMDFH